MIRSHVVIQHDDEVIGGRTWIGTVTYEITRGSASRYTLQEIIACSRRHVCGPIQRMCALA